MGRQRGGTQERVSIVVAWELFAYQQTHTKAARYHNYRQTQLPRQTSRRCEPTMSMKQFFQHCQTRVRLVLCSNTQYVYSPTRSSGAGLAWPGLVWLSTSAKRDRLVFGGSSFRRPNHKQGLVIFKQTQCRVAQPRVPWRQFASHICIINRIIKFRSRAAVENYAAKITRLICIYNTYVHIL